ncbi:MAG: DNA polymerase [Planctomycetota bacterium]|jgi:hypothetical protein
MTALASFQGVWLADFEFRQLDGARPEPICMVARAYPEGPTLRLWADELRSMPRPPFSIGPDSLFVAYYASAELGCFLVLDWAMPASVLDLFVEFRNLTNGLSVPCGNGLLGALTWFGLDGIGAAEKDSMRDLAQRGPPYTDSEKQSLLDYCESDVVALGRLLPAMAPHLDLPRALLRGRYMKAAARMERTGVPVDTAVLERLRLNWGHIKARLVAEVDKDYGVFVSTGRALNPESTLGAEILRTAEEWDIDPYQLADAVDTVWAEERDSQAELREAHKTARGKTGLDARRIAQWERSGRDGSTWPGLDVAARELAAEFPALGIGVGYDEATGYDDTDYAGRLWEILREGARPVRPKHTPEILNRAAEVVWSAGPDCRSNRLTFSRKRWAQWLADNGIPWPRSESGELDLRDETFREMARQHPEVAPIRELRHTLSQLRLNDLAVGPDGRNRCLLSAFRARSGRNAPSNSRSVFGPSCWLRGLIRPATGRAIAYVDWEQEEFGIAAALSGDSRMMEAYASGDPYLTFAKQAGAVPIDATKDSRPRERELFKTCALGVQYGMGPQSLAQRIGEPEVVARELLRLHRETYARFWEWSDGAVNYAMMYGRLHTVFGWTVRVGRESNPRSLHNHPMQANGAEMLRLACCFATERGIEVCAPVHDALLVEGPADGINEVVAATERVMAEASRYVLDGFELRTEANIVRWPDRYMDKRGVKSGKR